MAYSKSKQIHTVPRPDGWGNKSSGASRVAKVYPTKSERGIAMVMIRIRRKDNNYKTRRSLAPHFIHNLLLLL